jgi:glycosyltransferase involved in cell wall biosynthesis
VTVAQVVLTLDHGGLEYLAIQMSEHLQSRGIRSPIVVLTEGALVGEARRRGVDVFVMHKRKGFDVGLIFALRRLLRSEGVQVLHSHNFAPLIYGSLAARLCGIGTVNTRHGRAALKTHPLIWALTDRVVAVSEDARRELMRHNRIRADKVRVIINAIDLTRYKAEGPPQPERRRELGIPAHVPLCGIVGRLSAEKDHRTLLLALDVLRKSGSLAHLVIVGGGPLEGELKSLVESLGLSESVHFLGFRSDVAQLLPLFDVFVLSSTEEGISLTLIEAMAAGLPIVATRVGGNPEVVVEGETGVLIEAGQPEALASALESLLGDPDRRTRMGLRGREVATQRFDIKRLIDEYQAIYTEIGPGHAETSAAPPR